MSTKKSKNNPENRIKADKNFCNVCNTVKKYIKVSNGTGKNKMCTECKCGIFDKNGKKCLNS